MEVVVYTDASLCDNTHVAACGFIVYYGTKSICHEITLFDNVRSSNTGEIKAISLALQYCFLLEGVKNIILYTEIESVVLWRFNSRRVRGSCTLREMMAVVDIIKEYGVEIEFRKVKAHSHDRRNDTIDISVRKVLRDHLKKNKLRWQQRHT